mgnify:CR=1 FL=1
MLVSIGSRSIPKVTAITRAFSRYPELWINNLDKIEYIIMPKEVRKDENEGYCVAKVYSVLDERLVGWLFCCSDKVETVAPKELRDYLTERAQTVIQSYSEPK